jgi:hypothetical protein
MRSREEVALVLDLVRRGRNDCDIARETGIPRGTVRCWQKGRTPDFDRVRTFGEEFCPPRLVCGGDPVNLPQAPYTYLLGLYLGDGCLTACPREVYRLRIVCTNRYPGLIRECELAMAEVLPNKVSRAVKEREGCTEVASHSKHWLCLFPQHGPGKKHHRTIELAVWQQQLVDLDPRPLVRGLLHSDGCRVLNWGAGRPIPGTTSATCRPTSARSSGGHATSWGSNGGRTTAAASRWPGGTAWPCSTSS